MLATPPRSHVVLFGMCFHALVAAGLATVGAANRADVPARFYAMTVPSLLVAAGVAYALVVAPYVRKRAGGRGVVLFDSAVGMLAELVIVVLTSMLYALVAAALNGGDGADGLLSRAANGAVLAFLWTFANFATQILVLGNAAGLAGWLLLEKLWRPRAQRAARG